MKNSHEKLRYRIIYRLAHYIAPLLLRKYSFTTDKLNKTDGNYIVMANHVTEVDMLMVAAAFGQHMYIVAGEHLLRSRHANSIVWAQDPIFEYKGDVAVATVMEIVRRVRRGANVMIFPEGSRSFHGETERLPESVAKLPKLAHSGLITYRIEGGYFVAPRWAYTTRVGPIRGRIMHVWSAEEVAAMNRAELTEAINRDLYVNAFETQRKNRFRYRGERLAEGLENYLICCPVCGAFDTLATEDDLFHCRICGMAGRYTEEGFLEGKGLRFDSVYDWGKWAEAETERYIQAQSPDALCFTDEDIEVYEIAGDHRRIDLLSGSAAGYKDRLEVGDTVFLFRDILAMSMLYYGKTLLFSWQGRHIGITGERFHAIKYQKLYDVFKSAAKKHR